MAAAIFQMCCRLGNAVSLAIASLIRNAVEKSAQSPGSDDTGAALEGLHSAFWFLAGLSVFCRLCLRAGTRQVALTPAAAIVGFGMKGWEYLDSKPTEEAGDGRDDGTLERLRR